MPKSSTPAVKLIRAAVFVVLPLAAFTLVSCALPGIVELETSVWLATQDEMAARFGYPQRLKRSDGMEVWEYEFVAKGGGCMGYRIWFDDQLRSRHWERFVCR